MGDENYLCEKYNPYNSASSITKTIDGKECSRKLEEIANKYQVYHGEVKVSNISSYNKNSYSNNLYR